MHLTFQRRFIPLILSGIKTQTRRPLWQNGPRRGDIIPLRVPWCKTVLGFIQITRVFQQRFEDITREEIEKEGFQTLKDFKQAWEEIYGPTDGHEVVRVYEFKLASPGERAHPPGLRFGDAKRSTSRR